MFSLLILQLFWSKAGSLIIHNITTVHAKPPYTKMK